MIFVNIGKEPAVQDVNVADGSETGSRANDHHVFTEVVAIAHVGKCSHLTGDGIGEPHALAQSVQIVHAERRTFAGFVPFLLVGDDADAVDHESVRAQVSDFIGDVDVEAVENGDDGDQGGDGQDHAEQGQESTQFVRAQGIERNPDGFAQSPERLPGIS